MAEDWIKMRTDLYRDPRVSIIADALMDLDGDLARYVDQNCQRHMTVTRNVTRNATVGALLSVWGVMRHRGKRKDDDLVCDGVSVGVIDDMADMPGFGEAMLLSGWLVQTQNGLEFPRFFGDYNTEPDVKKTSNSAERQRRYREKLKAESDANYDVTRDVTRDVTVTPREEKRREEKNNKKPPKSPRGDESDAALGEHESFERFWTAWPRKDARQAASKAFRKLNPKPELVDRILADVRSRIADGRWGDPKYIPHASTYLNGKRWEDEPEKPKRVPYEKPDWLKGVL